MTGESPQHLKEHVKEHLSAPAASPTPRMGEATPLSLGENSKNGAQKINTSPVTNTVIASKKVEGGLGVRVQVPDSGAELRRQDEETKARRKASINLHAFLADALGTDGYAGWITRATPETEALLAEQLEKAPSGGAARRQRPTRSASAALPSWCRAARVHRARGRARTPAGPLHMQRPGNNG